MDFKPKALKPTFIDTHCHLFETNYEDVDIILKEACEAGVTKVISAACDYPSCKEEIRLATKFDNYYVALGIHPEAVMKYQPNDLKFIEKHLAHPKVCALGEIGLDYYRNLNTKTAQIELLEKQLNLAQKYKLPVVIHSRDALDATYGILKKYDLKGVIHSFVGTYTMAQKFIKLGYLIGVNGIITFKNNQLAPVIQKISPQNIILETDSPYLTPEPYRGQKNHPARIVEIAQYVSRLYGLTDWELAKITNENVKRIFDI